VKEGGGYVWVLQMTRDSVSVFFISKKTVFLNICVTGSGRMEHRFSTQQVLKRENDFKEWRKKVF
jgi:hypothetical protein